MFWKIFSDVWLCSWKYHRKHIFYLLFTLSHIFLAARQIYNIIHSSIQKHKQNPEKNIIKSGQIKRRRKRERRLGSTKGEVARRRWRRDHATQCCNHDRRGAAIAIDAKARSRSTQCCDDQTQFKRESEIEKERDRRHELRTQLRDLAAASGVGPLHLRVVLSLSLSPFARLWAPLFARLSSRSDLKVK